MSTLDLMLTLREASDSHAPTSTPSTRVVDDLVRDLLATDPDPTPSRLYLALLRHGLSHRWDLSHLDLRHITELLRTSEAAIDRHSARVLSANC